METIKRLGKVTVSYEEFLVIFTALVSVIFLMASLNLFVALPLALATNFLWPLEISFFSFDLTPVFFWLLGHQQSIGGLAIVTLIVCLADYRARR